MAFATQKHLMVYVKTTETCNLNCSHCFTSGSKGRKIYFKPKETAEWCNGLDSDTCDKAIHFEYHGGEPMLAPMEDILEFYNITKEHWGDRCTHGITTNLVFKIKDEHLKFFEENIDYMGTSWDPNIRFANEKQRKLWEDNVKLLTSRGMKLKCFISVSKDVVKMDPLEIADYMHSLGVWDIAYERLTHNGNATINLDIFPHNKELDDFWMRMHERTKGHPVKNSFLESVYDKFEKNPDTRAGTFCRDCEQKLHTINADGTIAGCPNSAPTDHYGHISEPVPKVRGCYKRMEIIASELHVRDMRCYSCPVFDLCHSDCHQLQWMDDVCPAPKSLMLKLAEEKNWIS